jgi:hypothetical protein
MKMNMRNFQVTLFLVAFFLVSCHSFQQSKPIEEDPSEPVEYPVGYIAQKISTNLTDSFELYRLPEEFLENFLIMRTQYEGTHPTVPTDFPKEWGVALVERLPEGRELYQVQSQNREWIFLVITSGYGTQRILDILPVAVNLVNQVQDIRDKEIWITVRESDGSFTVQKKYEWLRSVENVSQEEYEENPQNYLRAKTVTDKYFINDFFRFERVIEEDIPDYSAVIFYYKDEKPDDWDDNVSMLQAFCEDYTILFAEVHDHYNKVALYDYKYNFITELDITPYMNLEEGIIFLKKDVNPKSAPFGNFERMKIELKRYFKIVEV